ncbi:pacearchaeosortase [Candidatus Woesearchaeota archaeon]|nr:pacearchaeosortase [Candidatus Woesearchaeota archaeon]
MHYYRNLLLRVLLSFVPVSFFYWLFAAPTLYGSALFLSPYLPEITNNTLVLGNYVFEFVEACIAPSAYYLLWLLVLLTKDILWKKRILITLIGFSLLLLMNVIRIALLVFIAVHYGEEWFDAVHLLVWKLFSGFYVVVVWILLIHVFEIESIPVYSDLQHIYSHSLFLRKKH